MRLYLILVHPDVEPALMGVYLCWFLSLGYFKALLSPLSVLD